MSMGDGQDNVVSSSPSFREKLHLYFVQTNYACLVDQSLNEQEAFMY